jgi:GNAT superfamily N-acetyltransferase
VALERMVERRGPRWWARLIRHQRSVLVLEVHGTIAGYATLGANRSKTLRVHGEIYELYIEPAYQGLGFGARLFNAARERLKAARLGHFVVWALEDNARRLGFTRRWAASRWRMVLKPSSHPFRWWRHRSSRAPSRAMPQACLHLGNRADALTLARWPACIARTP